MSYSETDQRKLFGDIDDLIEIEIEGHNHRVPRYLELLRCFQFLNFDISFEHFCWNARCENCSAQVTLSDGETQRILCCQEPADEGVKVLKLPDKVIRR